jgi:type II secretory ATPase GspE/PulE/Tfp pilus assembly ATPase PilB-like protein
MGIEEYLVASTVSIAIGQRLVRKICPHCKEKYRATESLRESLKDTLFEKLMYDGQELYKGKGCDQCNYSGYIGRICINEVLVADEAIRDAILRKASASEIKNLAISRGMTTMFEDGFKKIEEGITTIEEILRVVHE